jgi:hypothetical protein
MKIKCTTLFDITRTNVNIRRNRLGESGGDNITKQRGQQGNFETVLQVISMRAQPEDITDPEKIMINPAAHFCASYKLKTKIPAWVFTFTVDKEEVFQRDSDKLALLHEDASGVPMATKLDEWDSLDSWINVGDTYKNIKFEICE